MPCHRCSTFVTPIPYVALQQMFDETFQWGIHAYDKGLYLEGLSDEAIAVITNQQPRKTSPRSVLFIFSLGNGYGDVEDDDTAFGGSRSARFSVFIVAAADNPEALPADRAWVRTFCGCTAAARHERREPHQL